MDNKEMNGSVASPTQDGSKISHDSDFLYFLKNSPLSKVKPDNILPELMIDHLQRAHNEVRPIPPGMRPNNDFIPGFVKGSRNTLPNRRSQGKPSVRPNASMGSPRPNLRQISLSLRSDVKLNETENAWRPSRMRSEDMEEDQKETQELLKKFRSVLNKLTPQKFDTLMAQVRELKIDTLERLRGVITLVFEKAIEEPNFSVTYALMCKELEQVKVAPVANEKPVSFRQLIVGCCQEEFTKGDNQDSQTDIREKEIEECTDPEKKKELQMALEEEKRKNRMRSVGNVRFIGELFKQSIITNNIMLICIEKLLQKLEEETLECLCKLLTTIGKDLETVHNKDLSKYFVQMQAIVEKKKGQNISSRVRFMIQDVIELRQKKWVPRKIVAQSNPKTIDQIQLEADMEQMMIYQNNYNTPTTPRQDFRNDRFDRPVNKRGASRSVNDDGWTQAPSSRKSKNTFTIDSDKLSKLTSSTPITQTSLTPTLVSWEKGATTKNYPSPRNFNNNVKKNSSTESKNMYDYLLQEQASETPTAAPPKKSGKNKSQKQDRPTTMRSFSLEYNKTVSSSSENISSNDTTGKIYDVLTRCQGDNVYSVMDMVDKHLVKKGIAIDIIIKEMFLWAIESNKLNKIQILGEVTGRMVSDKGITKQNFIDIFKKVILDSFDLFVEGDDNSWNFLAGFIWGHLVKDPLTMPEIYTILSKIVQVGKGYEFLIAFFNMKPDKEAAALWEEGKMSLCDWFSAEKEEKFRNSVKIQCFGLQQITSPEIALKELLVLMKAKTPVNKVDDWIQMSIPNPEDIWFIRALTEAVYTYVLCSSESAKPRFDDDQAKQRLESYYPLLITYIGNKQNPKIELHCLYAIQHLLYKMEHPMNISLLLFEHLCDSGEVVSNEAFLTWIDSKDPLEQEGKGVMLKSLTSFITALKSNEDSSDETSS